MGLKAVTLGFLVIGGSWILTGCQQAPQEQTKIDQIQPSTEQSNQAVEVTRTRKGKKKQLYVGETPIPLYFGHDVSAKAYRTPNGTLFGTRTLVSDGPILATLNTGFIVLRAMFKFSNYSFRLEQ